MSETTRTRLRWAGWALAFYTALGLLKFTYCYLDGAAHGEPASWLPILIEEMGGAYGGMLLLPLILWAGHQFRFEEGRWLESTAGHFGALERRLEGLEFVRLSRSHLVRVDFIAELRPSVHGEFEVVLRDGTRMPWTRRYRERTRDLILDAL